MVTKKKEKTPEQKAKMKMAQIKNLIRTALAKGDEKKAFAMLNRASIPDILECRLPKEYQSPAEPWFVEYDKRTKPVEEPSNGGAKDIFAPEVVATMPVSVVAEPNVEVLTPVEGQDIGFPSNEPAIEENGAPVEVKSDPVPMVRGWPVTADAEIWGQPRNPALMIGLLPDGRKVSVYQGRFRKFSLRQKVKLTLEQPFLDGERQGDPIYVAQEVRGNTW